MRIGGHSKVLALVILLNVPAVGVRVHGQVLSVPQLLEKAEASSLWGKPFKASYEVWTTREGKLAGHNKVQFATDGHRFRHQGEELMYEGSERHPQGKDRPYRDVFDGESFMDLMGIFGHFEWGGEIRSAESRYTQHADHRPDRGSWLRHSAYGVSEPFYELMERDIDIVEVAEVRSGDRILVQLEAGLPEGDYIIHMDPELDYSIVRSEVTRFGTQPDPRAPVQDTHWVADFIYEKQGDRYVVSSSTLLNEIIVNETGYRMVLEHTLQLHEFEFLKDEQIEDELFELEWPEGTVVYDLRLSEDDPIGFVANAAGHLSLAHDEIAIEKLIEEILSSVQSVEGASEIGAAPVVKSETEGAEEPAPTHFWTVIRAGGLVTLALAAFTIGRRVRDRRATRVPRNGAN